MAKFSFDAFRCTKCHACEVACETWHDKPAGKGYRVVEEVESGEFPNIRRSFASRPLPGCDLCADGGCGPRCVAACPSSALRFE